jgi:hypothetical protein
MSHITHRLTFVETNDRNDNAIFQILHQGFMLGGTAVLAQQTQRHQAPGFEERRAEARILRKIKSLGVPEMNESGVPLVYKPNNAPVYSLMAGVHALELTTEEFIKLRDFVKAAPWDTARMDAVEEMVDFVLRAEEVRSGHDITK